MITLITPIENKFKSVKWANTDLWINLDGIKDITPDQ